MRSQVESSLRLQLSNQSVEVYYQSVNHLEPQISLSHEWGYWSPRNGSRFLSVQVQKFHDFLFSLYLTAETTLMQDLAVKTKLPMSTKSDFPVVRFVEWSSFFIQLFQARFSCPPAAISIHNLQDESTSRLIKETGSHYIYSKKL